MPAPAIRHLVFYAELKNISEINQETRSSQFIDVLHVHKDLTDALDLSQVANEFVEGNDSWKQRFWSFNWSFGTVFVHYLPFSLLLNMLHHIATHVWLKLQTEWFPWGGSCTLLNSMAVPTAYDSSIWTASYQHLRFNWRVSNEVNASDLTWLQIFADGSSISKSTNHPIKDRYKSWSNWFMLDPFRWHQWQSLIWN